MNRFEDRKDAGKKLALLLLPYKDRSDVNILALPRGGVPVAFEVAQQLSVPMTVFLVRKLGVPDNKELAMGAIAENDICFLNENLIQQLHISENQVKKVIENESQELLRRLKSYRHNKILPDLHDKIVILIDDGIATGATAKVAIQALKKHLPKKIILATPVASKDGLQELSFLVDETFCVMTPAPFYGVAQWYRYFEQTTDEEVLTLLKNS